MGGSARRWPGFLGWTLAGACLTLAVSQIGVFTIPIGIVLVAVCAYWAPRDALGFLEGAGIVCAVIGAMNLDYRPCPSGGTTILEPGQTDAGCGGFDGTPWLVAGLAVSVAVALVWLTLRRRGR